MENQEREVWQRVFGQPAAPRSREDLPALAAEVRELAALYRQLMKGTSGKLREKLGQLYEGELANLACLKGMAVLSGTPMGRQPPLPDRKEPMGKALKKACHRTRRALVEYTARSADPEFGAVFRQMAARAEKQWALAAELLGSVHL